MLKTCTLCHRMYGEKEKKCPFCGIEPIPKYREEYRTCFTCNGSGNNPLPPPLRKCHHCGGSGRIKIW